MVNFLLLKSFGVSYSSFPLINGFLHLKGKGKLIFGSNVKINSNYFANQVGLSSISSFVALNQNSQIFIGNNVGISNSLLYARESIIIKDDVLIGGGCQILDNDFHSLELKNRLAKIDTDIKANEVIIKEGAFIGANSIILKGVHIGKQSVVGAGSVVVKSIPDFEIWAGNPARFIKKVDC